MLLPRLKPGSHIRVIAPSRSLAIVSPDVRDRAEARLRALGFEVTFGENVMASGFYQTADPEARLADLHAAFQDPSVDGVLTAVGGTRCTDLLPGIDWSLIESNPKVLCGYSDITTLEIAIWARSRVVTFSGPHFSSFAMDDPGDYQLSHFLRAVSDAPPALLVASDTYSDDLWYEPNGFRTPMATAGWLPANRGDAEGTLLGGNLYTFLLLQGTDYAPRLDGTILFVEDIASVNLRLFRRGLIALSLLPGFSSVRGLIVGRFQSGSGASREDVAEMIESMPQFRDMPVVAEFDIGHTQPIVTLPVGGRARLVVEEGVRFELLPD